MLAIRIPSFLRHPLALAPTCKRTQHWLDWWTQHPTRRSQKDERRLASCPIWIRWTFNCITCHPWSNRLRSTARSHITASPAWKSRNLRQRSCKNIPKHFKSSEVDAYLRKKISVILYETGLIWFIYSFIKYINSIFQQSIYWNESNSLPFIDDIKYISLSISNQQTFEWTWYIIELPVFPLL